MSEVWYDSVCCPVCGEDMHLFVTHREHNNVACKCPLCGQEFILKNTYMAREWEHEDRLAEEADEP